MSKRKDEEDAAAADEPKREKVTVGRPIIHDNVHYGAGVHEVEPAVAAALRAKGATASVAETMRRERERSQQAASAPKDSEGKALEGGTLGAGASGGDAAKTGAQGEGGDGTGGEGGEGTASRVESLTGELPEDFPARDKLEAAGVTTYDQLTKLSREEIDEFPGIGSATVEQIGQRLLADAEGRSE